MNKPDVSTLIAELALDRVQLIDIRTDPGYCKRVNMPSETFVNRSFCIGNEIVLGVYEDQELRLVSFLHELGHIEEKVGGGYENEQKAWDYAFNLAEKLGLRFSSETLSWCQVQLGKYGGNETTRTIPRECATKYSVIRTIYRPQRIQKHQKNSKEGLTFLRMRVILWIGLPLLPQAGWWRTQRDNFRIGAVAVFLLGEGKLGLQSEDGEQATPIVFGWEEWLEAQGVSDLSAFIDQNRSGIADALDSVRIGEMRDRCAEAQATKYMTAKDAEKYRAEIHDTRRSSMNDIGGRAWQLGKSLRGANADVPPPEHTIVMQGY